MHIKVFRDMQVDGKKAKANSVIKCKPSTGDWLVKQGLAKAVAAPSIIVPEKKIVTAKKVDEKKK